MEESLPRLTEGQRVLILADPFAGHEGSVGTIDGDRVTVLTSLFGRPTPVTVPYEQLRPAA
jgi:transcription antitermination factor NusG